MSASLRSVVLLPFIFCFVEAFKEKPYVPLALKNEYRRSYLEPKIRKYLEKGEIFFGSEIRKHEGQQFYLLETMGLSEAPDGKAWSVLRSGENYDEFLPFLQMAEKRESKEPGVDVYEIKFGLWGFNSHMWVHVKDCQAQGPAREFRFVVREGSFLGMEGRFVMEPWKSANPGRAKKLVFMEAHWLQAQLTIPKVILEMGMEFALQRIGRAMLNRMKT